MVSTCLRAHTFNDATHLLTILDTGYAIAAGLIAGEGIGGVVNAVFQIAGIAGPDPYGTTIACPAGMC